MRKILVVEDDKHILAGLVDNLKMEGYTTIIARDGEAALKQVKERAPDLVILDVMLPKLNGFEVCKRLKSGGSNVPIIILSAQGEEADKVLGLELGADDYVTKPFSPRELVVRIKAVLRRAGARVGGTADEVFEFDEMKVDFKCFQVFKKGREVKLTSAEFKILKLLLINKGEPVSRHTILGDIWSADVTTRTVDTHIWNLREKLEDDPGNPKHIMTVHRIGYKFVE
jgi:DNA-binding response OmpR family regulator